MEDGQSLSILVQGKKLKLDEKTLRIILDVLVIGVRSVGKQQPSI